ncbi:hypothetical protein DMA11_08680 [Marinilabiliaceae bacterium JC017]|nr:hypothetical protein DMA11_08680 [Marinilabiliaceae bacterium JC017]
MSNNRLHFLFTIIMVWLLPVLTAAKSTDTIIVQLKWTHQFQFAGYYAAIEKGFYADKGLKVKLKEGVCGIDVVKEVLEGRATYGTQSPKLLIHRNNNKPVVAIATFFQHSPEILLTTPKKQIYNPKDVIGKKLSLSKNNLTAPRAILLRGKVPLNKVNLISSGDNINALLNGEADIVDAYITDAPYLLEKKGFHPIIIRPLTYGIDFYGDCLFTSEKEVTRINSHVNPFLEATIKGWEYAMLHKEEIIDLIIEKYPSRLAKDELMNEAMAMEELILPLMVQPGHMNPERWHHIAQTYVKLGLLKPDYSLDGFLLSDYQQSNKKNIKLIIYVLLIVLFIAFFIILLITIFNQRLKQAVQKRTRELSRMNKNLIQEITERKRFHSELILSEDRYKRLFDDSPISLWEEDFSQVKILIDHLMLNQTSELEGYFKAHPAFLAQCVSQIKITNINKATLKYLRADNIETVLSNIDKIFTGDSFHDFKDELVAFYNGNYHHETESEHMTFSGDKLWVSINVTVPPGYEHNWKKVIVSLIDITDLKNTTYQLKENEKVLIRQNDDLKERNIQIEAINRELEKAKLKAEESDRLKSAFLSNMSHEIRTPMNGIIGFTDLLRTSDLSHEEKLKYIDIIEDNSQQLLRIISDIIDISKIEAGQLKIMPAPMELDNLFKGLYEVFCLKLKTHPHKTVDFSYEINPAGSNKLMINSDKARLRQVLSNLIENAIKFTREGNIKFGAHVDANKRLITFYVSDTGTGISQERLSRIFERFFKEENRINANLGGTGLGLSIAKNLVELLGGQIWVDSEINKGSTFYFTHPV